MTEARHTARRGFSLPELLVTIGVVALLAAWFLPALGRTREAASAVVCASDLRQMAARVALYAGDHDGRVPFVYERDDAGGWVGPSGAALPSVEFLETAADFWAFPMLDEFGGSFVADGLLCPDDTTTRRAGEWAAAETGRPIERVGVPMARGLSRAWFYRPSSLANDRDSITAADFRVARLSDARFPASKALIVEQHPFHEPGFIGPELTEPFVRHRKTVAAADGSAALRANTETLRVVLIGAPDSNDRDPDERDTLLRLMGAFQHTRDGVEGRDW